jgi:hypothetical protein
MERKIMKKRKDKVLAEGEMTGHSHTLIGPVEVYDDDNGDRLAVRTGKGPVRVTHEEHRTMSLLPGTVIRTFRQREIDPDTEEVRNVAD